MADEVTRFQAWLGTLPFQALPPRVIDACCLLTQDQDAWGVALGSFLLAKQAGMELTFHSVDRALPQAQVYLMPSIKGMRVMPRRRWQELLDRVAAGATLYLSFDGGWLSGFESLTGMRVVNRQRLAGAAEATLDLPGGKLALCLPATSGLVLEPAGAEVLGRAADGNPVLTRFSYGQGKVVFLGLPLEAALADLPGAFWKPGATAFWRIYREVVAPTLGKRIAGRRSPQVSLTEHPMADGSRILVLMNFGSGTVDTEFTLARSWVVQDVLRGTAPRGQRVFIPGADAVVLKVGPK